MNEQKLIFETESFLVLSDCFEQVNLWEEESAATYTK